MNLVSPCIPSHLHLPSDIGLDNGLFGTKEMKRPPVPGALRIEYTDVLFRPDDLQQLFRSVDDKHRSVLFEFFARAESPRYGY